MIKKLFIVLAIFMYGCKSKVEKIKPTIESISESIYASGTVKSKNQYQAFAPVNGIVEDVFVSEGDTIKKGASILSVSNEAQRLNKENAELTERFSDLNANQGKLNEAKLFVELDQLVNKRMNGNSSDDYLNNLVKDFVKVYFESENSCFTPQQKMEKTEFHFSCSHFLIDILSPPPQV